MVIRGKIILRDTKSILKKTILFLCLLLLPFLLSADITVNWQPQVGISYTFENRPNPFSWGEGTKKFVLGFSGGVDAEVRFISLFGIKAGVNYSQLVTRTFYEAMFSDGYGNLIDSDSKITKLTINIPVLAMFYFTTAELLEIYGGVGAVPAFVTYDVYDYYDKDTFAFQSVRYRGYYYTGFSADLGLHWKTGIGTITAGFAYMLFIMGTAPHQYYSNNVKFYTGYMF